MVRVKSNYCSLGYMTTMAHSYRVPQPPADLPPPLPQPDLADVPLEQVMAALSETLRLEILRRLLTSSDAWDHSCGWFDIDRPKSTLTHHFKVLRSAGLITQRQYGLERRSRVRLEEIQERFPGLIDLVLA